MMNNKRLGESNDRKFDNHLKSGTTVARGMINTRLILVYSRLQNIVREHFFQRKVSADTVSGFLDGAEFLSSLVTRL